MRGQLVPWNRGSADAGLECVRVLGHEDHKHEAMTLDKRDAETFFEALSKPTKFNAKLLSAFKEHAERVVSK